MKNKILLLLLVATIFSSCRKDTDIAFNPQDYRSFSSWDELFESYWIGMNHSYSLWDIDPTDWDAVYKDYKPRFKELEFGNREDSITATKYFDEMTTNIIDHHYKLRLYNKKGMWWSTDPGRKEVYARDYYHEHFSEENLGKTINENNAKGRITDLKYGNGGEMYAYSYNIDNGIAYLYLSLFMVYGNQNNVDVMGVISNFLDIIKNNQNLKGIILDTRGNRGGYIVDIDFIISPLINEELLVGHTKSKNGMGRLDYSPWVPFVIYPNKKTYIGKDISNVPIISLVDINSVSMGEMTSMAIKTLPNGCVIGERTFGGHGPLDGDFRYTYSGSFSNSSFLVYTSTSIFRYIDGNIYEGLGIVPDIEALYNKEEFLNGNDTQLDRAIEYINTKK